MTGDLISEMQKLQHSFKVHHYLHKPRFYCNTMCSATQPDRFAIIGGGIAGVSTAFHLASLSHPSPIHIDLFDARALGAGASGAAAGILHPYNSRGNLLWNGLAAFQEALNLVQAAEQAMLVIAKEEDDTEEKKAGDALPFVWRHGVVRPARDDKQAKSIERNLTQKKDDTTLAELLTADALSKCVPGLHLPSHTTTTTTNENNNQVNSAGFIVPSAIVLHPVRYLHALWKACQLQAASNGGAATLHLNSTFNSVQQLHDNNNNNNNGRSPYKAVIIAAGAAMSTIHEAKDTLPIELCHGCTLEMKYHQDDEDEEGGGEGGKYPQGAPSILGPTYIAAHGSDNIIVGATKKHGITPEQALQQCLGTNDTITYNNSDSIEQQEATTSLLKAAAAIWKPLTNSNNSSSVGNNSFNNSNWKVAAVKLGVRALPTRLPHLGSIPYAGRVETTTGADTIPCWVIGGLGSRGLLYHAWLGKVVAGGVLSDDEGVLSAELLRWKK